MPGPQPIVTNLTWGDAAEGLGDGLTFAAENTDDESYHEDADKQYQCMKDFFEFNNKKMMNYFQIESVTRVFVDKDGNLIEENGKSDKVKSDMKNSEIENKVILFKVKMK